MKLAKTALTPPIYAISVAFVFVVLATGSAFGGAGTFSGTGRYLDPNNWSGKAVPTASDGDTYLTGTAGATNETEILYGGKYMHIGGTSGNTATLDVVNSGFKNAAFRMGHKAGGSAVYRQNGGWFYHAGGSIGYQGGFKSVLIDFTDVAVTNGGPFKLGNTRSASGDREDITYRQVGGSFNSSTLLVGGGNQAYVCFSNVVGRLSGIEVNGSAYDKALVRIEDSPWTHTGEGMYIYRGRMEFVNCPEVTLYKHRIGHQAGARGELYLTNSVVLKNTYQSFIGSTANATGLVTLVDSVWTNLSSNVEVGGDAGAFGRICLKGKSWYVSKNASIQLGRAAGGTGEFEFDGVPTNCLKKTASLQLGYNAGCNSHLIYRNIPDPFTPSYSHSAATGSRSTVEFVNSTANVSWSSFSTSTSTNWLNLVLNDNATLNWKYKGTLWFCNQNHTRGGIYATNSTVTVDIGGNDLKIEKPHSVAEFVFKDSTASFVADGNVRAADSATTSTRLAVAGEKSDVTMGWLYLNAGTTTVDLDGGTLAFNRFVVANAGTQHLNFNGTTLKSRVWTDNWIGNGANMDARILEGGFDALWATAPIYGTGEEFSDEMIGDILRLRDDCDFAVVFDESLALPGQELVRRVDVDDSTVFIYSPHKAISVNSRKFSALVYDRRFLDSFNDWTDVFGGALPRSCIGAVYHYVSDNYHEVCVPAYLEFIRRREADLAAAIAAFPGAWTAARGSGHYRTVFTGIPMSADERAVEIVERVRERTGYLFYPSTANGFTRELGLAFRVNLLLDRSSIREGVASVLSSLEKMK